MKKQISLGIGIAVIVALSLYGIFLIRRMPAFRFVKVETEGWVMYCNYFRSDFEMIVGKDEDNIPLLPVWENDILYVSYTSLSDGFFLPYAAKDNALLLLKDERFLLLKDGKPVSLNLYDDQSLEWVKNAQDEEIASLRFIYINFMEMDPAKALLLQKVAKINPHVGLMVEASVVDHVLSFFTPSVLFLNIDAPLTGQNKEFLSRQHRLHTLWVNFSDDYDAPSLTFLSKLSRLRHLKISGADTIEISTFPALPENLYAFRLSGWKKADLSHLTGLSRLRELSLLSCDIKDPKALLDLKDLTAIDLTKSSGAEDISLLKHMKALRYAGLPPGISQKDLTSFIETHPYVEILQMIGGRQVNDFSSLEKLSYLQGLVLFDEAVDDPETFNYASLHGVKNLRYLALCEEILANEEKVLALQNALLRCQIVLAGGICLGSGWILLLALVALLAFLRKRTPRGERTRG
ncbi:MAG: hypothetical protein KAR32_05950 [Candidatus Omnitrophica bacterium]|nr:hypothetical protein [Candidatus Omnitrophota bacterium]